jgi:hypothetical protein
MMILVSLQWAKMELASCGDSTQIVWRLLMEEVVTTETKRK